MNGEIRDREKTTRGLKIVDTPVLPGMQIFHNYIRGHSALNGATPSEACGLKVDGKDPWKTLIQNARMSAIRENPSNGNNASSEENPLQR